MIHRIIITIPCLICIKVLLGISVIQHIILLLSIYARSIYFNVMYEMYSKRIVKQKNGHRSVNTDCRIIILYNIGWKTMDRKEKYVFTEYILSTKFSF